MWILMFSILFGSFAWAQDCIELNLSGGGLYRAEDDKFKYDKDNFVFNSKVSYINESDWGLDLSYTTTGYDGKYNENIINMDFLLIFDFPIIQPFVAAGGGVDIISEEGYDEKFKALVDGGFGAFVILNECLSWRSDFRYNWVDYAPNNEFIITTGISYRIPIR